jgi:hypothetical protein
LRVPNDFHVAFEQDGDIALARPAEMAHSQEPFEALLSGDFEQPPLTTLRRPSETASEKEIIHVGNANAGPAQRLADSFQLPPAPTSQPHELLIIHQLSVALRQ